MTEVTIKINIPNEIYSDYEEVINSLTGALFSIGVESDDLEIIEKEIKDGTK